MVKGGDDATMVRDGGMQRVVSWRDLVEVGVVGDVAGAIRSLRAGVVGEGCVAAGGSPENGDEMVGV